MITVDVCIETVFTDQPYPERIRRVAEGGFKAVEFWFHDQRFDGIKLIDEPKDMKGVRDALSGAGMALSNFVLNSPEGDNGGSLVQSEDRAKYLSRLKELVPWCNGLGCRRLITCAGNVLEGRTWEEQRNAMTETLTQALPILEKEDITLLLEPLNTRVDHPGYFLDSVDEGITIVRELSHPRIRLLFDIYHVQIMHGDILSRIEANLEIIGHFHAAGVPGRHELSQGELNYRAIFDRLSSLGYERYFGLEYFPSMGSAESLAETKNYLGI